MSMSDYHRSRGKLDTHSPALGRFADIVLVLKPVGLPSLDISLTERTLEAGRTMTGG